MIFIASAILQTASNSRLFLLIPLDKVVIYATIGEEDGHNRDHRTWQNVEVTMNRFVLASVFALVSTSVFAQSQAPASYNPGTQATATQQPTVPATQPAAPKVDPAEQARKSLVEWQNKKRDCFKSAKLTEGTDFRLNPANPANFQVKESVYFSGQFDGAAVGKCVAL